MGGIKLLLVDDRPDERMALRKQIMQAGLEVSFIGETAVGGEAIMAVAKLEPDIVFVSLEEPLGRPLRLLEAITMAGEAPVIAVSSLSDRDCLRKAMRAGARDYLFKPFNAEELASTVESALESQRQRKAVTKGNSPDVIRSHGEVITVFGNKGGIGKTTLATNLAVSLALHRKRVAILDLNFEHPDVPVMLNMDPRHSLSDVVPVLDRLEADVDLLSRFMLSHNSGLEVMAAPPVGNGHGGVGRQDVARVIEALAGKFEYLVVDTAPRLENQIFTALDEATLVLLVTTPDVPSLKNTRVALETLQDKYGSEDKIKLWVNEAHVPDNISSKDVGKVLDYPIFWITPYDRQVQECIRTGKPCVQAREASKVSRSISDLARALSGADIPRKGFLRKIGKGTFL